ncbi:MAG: hypothetical protein KJO54_10590 [Gammaproteobacteria bacterium]|nr:hypothetical protein [Gammaproteobacteria bacterium]NNF61368.1 hypothetical protein [Gammaproteobacteria bacterium]
MGFNFSSRPNRRYLIRLGSSMAVVLVALAIARYLTTNALVDGPLVWVLALIPGFAMLGAFYAFGMLIIEQKDEFIRMLVIRQWIIATGIALSFATVWGFLEEFELVAHLKPLYFVVMWFVGFAFGGLVNRLTHGAWGEMG